MKITQEIHGFQRFLAFQATPEHSKEAKTPTARRLPRTPTVAPWKDRSLFDPALVNLGFYKGNHPQMAVGQNLVPLVNIKIAGKWMFIPLKMYL